MKQQELKHMKAILEEHFAKNPGDKNIQFLLEYLTINAGKDYAKERTYTETQLKKLIELVSPSRR